MVRRTSKIVRRTLKSIWCDSQTKDERKRNGQKRAAMSHISDYVLDIYLAMPKRSVAAAPNIYYSYILGIFEYFCSSARAYFCIKINLRTKENHQQLASHHAQKHRQRIHRSIHHRCLVVVTRQTLSIPQC